ncbi:hypothetical protein [Maribacter polysaccharolyticus]|uniref:hypothetical protein n=1 Tax=Maribacter polysaccharolyticus TaxID=3020831 RepID=UPI00237F5A0B|nr:hypothetical protein [Maribacter polysaccharolyticus]MDE3741214.1 hypothetical protein [Maribacter polysaccharolyticus]
MSVIDFLNIPAVSSPRLSPNGKQIVYTLSESDWDANKQVEHLWIENLEKGTSDQFKND